MSRPLVVRDPPPRPLVILFACRANAGRSQISAAWCTRLASSDASQELPRAIARSAGTLPATHVHPLVFDAMKEVGIELTQKPQLLTSELVSQVDVVVTMGCEDDACPSFAGKDIVRWSIEDPKNKSIEEVRRIRDLIKLKVQTLLEEKGLSRSSL